MKIIATFLSKLALVAAKQAAGSASQWCQCQPKEPKELKQLISK